MVELASFENAEHGEGAIYSSEGRRHIFNFLKKRIPLSKYDTTSDIYIDAQANALGIAPHKFRPRLRFGSLQYKKI